MSADIRRLRKSRALYLSVPGVALTLAGITEGLRMGGMEPASVSEAYLMAAENSAQALTFLICALPFGDSIREDVQESYLRQQIIRGSLKGYLCARIPGMYLSSAAVMTAGTVLYAVLMRLFLPWTSGSGYAADHFLGGILKAAHPLLFLAGCGLLLGLLAGTLSVLGALLSLLVQNRLLVFSIPALAALILKLSEGKAGETLRVFWGAPPGENPLAVFLLAAAGSLLLAVLGAALIALRLRRGSRREGRLQRILESRFGAFALLLCSLLWVYEYPLRKTVQELDYPVSWCVLPFLLCDGGFAALFWLGIVYLHSGVPSLEHQSLYLLIRTGRKRWMRRRILGIFLRSLAAALLAAAAGILLILPGVEWSGGWGRLLRTLAVDTRAASAWKLRFPVYYETLQRFTPLGLMGLCLLLLTAVSFFLGLLMLAVSLDADEGHRFPRRAKGHGMAAALGTLLAILPCGLGLFRGKALYALAHLIPTAWAFAARQGSMLEGIVWFPSARYLMIVLPLMLGVLILRLFYVIGNCDLP